MTLATILDLLDLLRPRCSAVVAAWLALAWLLAHVLREWVALLRDALALQNEWRLRARRDDRRPRAA